MIFFKATTAWNGPDDEVLIPRGAGSTQVGDLLTEAGVIKSTKAFRSAVEDAGARDKLQYGRFALKKELPAATALEMLLDPKNVVNEKVTFPEGTTFAQQQAIMAEKFDISAEELKTAASIAKVVGTETAGRVIDRCIQVMGALGVAKELPLERWYREMRIKRIGEGPSEVHRMVLARQLLSGR